MYNRTEQRMNYWIHEGGDARSTYSPDFVRFPIVYKWQNTRGNLKSLDATGVTFSGYAWAIESKSTIHERFKWAEINERQVALLNRHVEVGAYALLWLGFTESDKKETPRAYFLIPWRECLWLQENVTYQGRLAKSVTIDDLRARVHNYELIAVPRKRSNRWDWEFFTQTEQNLAQDFERSYLVP